MIHSSLIVIVATALFCCCVSAQESSKCGPNEARYPCGKRCEDRCSAPRPSICHSGLQCNAPFGCRCKDDWARDPREGLCVQKEHCPKNNCAYGEFEGACGRTCEGTCENPRTPEICSRIRCGVWSCRCDLDGGFVRNHAGTCVRKEEC